MPPLLSSFKGCQKSGLGHVTTNFISAVTNNLTTECIYHIRGTFGGNFNLAVLALIAKFNLRPHYKNHVYYEAMYT